LHKGHHHIYQGEGLESGNESQDVISDSATSQKQGKAIKSVNEVD
jgi:hypothetical protein